MTERLRVMLVRPVELDGRVHPAGEYGFMVDVQPPFCVVETPTGKMCVHPHSLVEVPVPAPDQDRLCELDPCFSADPLAFEERWVDAERGFRVLRCREHGRHFLELMRRQPVRYRRLVFLGDGGDPDQAWEGYGTMPDDLLNYLGIAR